MLQRDNPYHRQQRVQHRLGKGYDIVLLTINLTQIYLTRQAV
jgi:hypothetical protein